MIKPKIILASASIGRKGLLEKLSVPFEVMVSRVNEETIVDQNPYKMLRMRATAKAEDTAKKLTVDSFQQSDTKRFLIIASDSMAVLGKKVYGKSKNKADSKKILLALMGKTHIFATAVSIVLLEQGKIGQRWESVTKTQVTLNTLSNQSLNEYLERYDFTRFAAAYTFNETPWDLIKKIDGSYTNVIGLPFEVLLPILRKLNLLK